MKSWSGRFTKDTDSKVDAFQSSISFDQRLYKWDIAGSIAHASMLAKQGIISEREAGEIIAALEAIETDIEAGRVSFDVTAEDIHMNIEKLLIERIGESGKKLHTARSRNDQVALDLRMFLKEEIVQTAELLADFQEALLAKAEQHRDTIMPGYTHLQKAQPVLFAHHLLAYFEMFSRDLQRLMDCYRRTDVMPLGSGALAGTTFPIDREAVREQLGFQKCTRNSMDAVSDRDFVLEYVFAASLVMMHLSRLCEELVLWSSEEFKYVEVDDAFGTGSSIMPQKKNPDVAELIRGKTGRVYGDLMSLLTVMKGLPLAYNKDMQEDKESLFDAVDTVKRCLAVAAPMVATLKVYEKKMYRQACSGFVNATDAADYLAARGIPFRQAHEIVGRIVLHCILQNRQIGDLDLDELKEFSQVFDSDVYDHLAVETCVSRRDVPGGTAQAQVGKALEEAKRLLADNRQAIVAVPGKRPRL